jgi:GH24 family phage-related lysozyme (muramidase)
MKNRLLHLQEDLHKRHTKNTQNIGTNPVTYADTPTSINQLKTSEKGKKLIISFEHFSPTLYDDTSGHCTIGIGHMVHRGKCNGTEPEEFKTGIDEPTAKRLFFQDLSRFEQAVNLLVKVPLEQSQFDALVSFTFNIGINGLKRSTLLKVLNQGRYDEVPLQLSRWIYTGSEKIPGLIKRRKAEAALWNHGKYQPDMKESRSESFSAEAVLPAVDFSEVLRPTELPVAPQSTAVEVQREIATENFSIHEFRSPDGVEVPEQYYENLLELMHNLEILRAEMNHSPVYILSGYRSEEFNREVIYKHFHGPLPDSKHLYALAADIRLRGHSSQQVHDTILRLIREGKMKGGGVKWNVSQDFVHYDIRNDRMSE